MSYRIKVALVCLVAAVLADLYLANGRYGIAATNEIRQVAAAWRDWVSHTLAM